MLKFVALTAAALTLATTACAQSEGIFDPNPKSPADWSPSAHGPDDRLGALNYITPEKTAAAARLVTTGKTYALGMAVGPNTPAYGPRSYSVTVLQLSDGTGQTLGVNKASGNDDIVNTWVGIGSQIDGLGHMGTEHTYYNGVKAGEFVAPDGLKQFSIHNLPPIATRGILLDMTKFMAADPVADGTAFNRAEIDGAAMEAGVEIEPGDVVIFHTGKMAATSDDAELSPGEPGLGVEGARYLASLGVVAVGADSWAVEAIPFENAEHVFPVHPVLLAENGVYILENMVTDELAADGVTEFFFTLGAPRLEGTVQSMVNPVAIR